MGLARERENYEEEGASERNSYGLTTTPHSHLPTLLGAGGRGVRNEEQKLSLGSVWEKVLL